MYSTRSRVWRIVRDATDAKDASLRNRFAESDRPKLILLRVSSAKEERRKGSGVSVWLNECLCEASAISRKRVEFSTRYANGDAANSNDKLPLSASRQIHEGYVLEAETRVTWLKSATAPLTWLVREQTIRK